MKKQSRSSIPSQIKVGPAIIDLMMADGRFLGLGKITVHGVSLRAATVPLRPEILTPDGIRYDTFRLDAVRSERGEVVLVTTAFGCQAMFGEYRDEYDHLLAWPRVAGGPFADVVEWRLRPESLTLEDTTYTGFSYALRFRSKQRSIHQVLMEEGWGQPLS